MLVSPPGRFLVKPVIIPDGGQALQLRLLRVT